MLLDGVSVTDDDEENESDYTPGNESDVELEFDTHDDEFDEIIDNGGDERQDDISSRFSNMTLKGAPVKSGDVLT